MAQLTKAQLLKLSEAMETVYADIQDELLINIARHIGDDFATPSGRWEIQKLSELGMINDESIKIIAKHSRLNQTQVRQIINNVTKDALKDIEPALKKATDEGFLNLNVANIDESQAMQNMMALYYQQAVDKMNMTNATLLESAVDTYSNTVRDIANEERILNTATGATLSRYTTRQQATRTAMKKMADEGLTGFIDRAGRQWSPEAYASMVIRTTAHNVNIDAVKTRQQEYGSDLFQVSVHGGARPLCYPYQDKIYSWGSATGGEFEDGAGRTIKYGSFINDTSQDKPAGLFGINCGHHPFPIIPGYSVVHNHYVQPMKENDEEYIQSQKQRALERDIRAKKRQYEIDKVSGASEADLVKDKQAISQAQANMRGFIKETGRTRIYSREQVEHPTQDGRLFSEPSAKQPLVYKDRTKGVTNSDETVDKYFNQLKFKTDNKDVRNLVKSDMKYMPEKDLEYLVNSKMPIKQAKKGNASYFYKSPVDVIFGRKGTMFIHEDAKAGTFAHEFAHGVAQNEKLMNKPLYGQLVDRIKNNVKKVTSEKIDGKNYAFIHSDYFVKKYQGRTYIPADKWKKATDKKRMDMRTNLLEFPSVSYELFISDPDTLFKKDPELYNYYERNGITGE